MTKQEISRKWHIPFLSMICLVASSCSAFGVKIPVREYSQYPALNLNFRDARYPAALGFLNAPDYLIGTIDHTQLIGHPELKDETSLLYKKSTKSVVKTFKHSFNSQSGLIVGDYAIGLNYLNSTLSVLSLLSGDEKTVSLDFLKIFANNSSNQSFIYKDRAYILLANAIIVYNTQDLISSSSPKPIWYSERDLDVGTFDSVTFDQISGDLFYTSRVQYPGNVYADAFITRLDYDGKEVSKFKVLTNLLTPSAYLSLAIKDKYLYTLGGGKLQLRKYDFQNHLVWETPGYICPGGSTPIPSSLIRYNNTLLVMPLGDTCFSAWNTETGEMRWNFQSPNKFSFVNTPLLLNNVLYAANQYMWALDFDTGKILAVSEKNNSTQGETGTPQYDAASNQIILWGTELQFYKPLK
jgi:hypothetical protein